MSMQGNKPTQYYRLTEWPLVKRWLLISALVVGLLITAWFVINLQFTYCPGDIDCRTAPKHSLRNLL